MKVDSWCLVMDTFPGNEVPEPLPACIETPIAAWRSHHYFVDLEADEYLRLRVDQLGADVLIVIRGSSQALRFDSPNGRDGIENVHFVAPSAGTYRIEIRSEETGRYRLERQALRLSEANDRRRAEAQKLHLEATGRAATGPRRHVDAKARAAAYLRAAELWRRTNDSAEESWALYDLLARDSGATGTLNDGERGELFDRAVELHRGAGNQWRASRLLHRKGSYSYSERRYGAALRSYERSLEGWRELGNLNEQAAVLNLIGLTHQRLDSIDRSIESFHMARGLYRSRSDRCGEGAVWINIGRVEANRGETSSALQSFVEALRLLEPCSRAWAEHRALGLTKQGDMKMRLRDLPGAVRDYEQALAVSRADGDFESVAMTLNSFGLARIESHQSGEALVSLTESRRLFKSLGKAEKAIVVLGNICRARESIAAFDRAEECYREVLSEAESLSYQNLTASLHTGLARMLIRKSEADAGSAAERLIEARSNLELALEIIEAIRSRSQRRDLRATFLAGRQEIFYLATRLAWLMNRQMPEENPLGQGLVLIDRGRARNLLDSIGRLTFEQRRSSAISTGAIERLNSKHLELMAAGVDGEVESDAPLRELVQSLRQTRDTEAVEKTPRAVEVSLKEIQASLGDALLLLFQAPDPSSKRRGWTECFVWLVSAQGIDLKLLEGFPDDSELRSLHRLLSSPPAERKEPMDELLLGVSRGVLDPLRAELENHRRLLVVPTGGLQYIPLGALLFDQGSGERKPLISSHSIGRLPSASSLSAIRSAQSFRREAAQGALLIGDAVFGPADLRLQSMLKDKLPPLPSGPAVESPLRSRLVHSAREVESIQGVLGEKARKLTGFDVQKSSLIGSLESYAVLHFATHGLARTDLPELASLMLSQYDADGLPVPDGFLRAYEIESMGFSADLVVLSACSSGLGRRLFGEGLIGLPHAFMASGVPRVVVSLWDIDDRSTADLMSRFYRRLQGGRGASEALRLAQVGMLQEAQWQDPFYWAAFIHHGDPF